MTTAQAVIQKVLSLPAEKQKEVLDYLQHIESGQASSSHLFNPEGITASPHADLTLEEFQQNRRAMWGNSTDEELK